jgi:hypothetical protein
MGETLMANFFKKLKGKGNKGVESVQPETAQAATSSADQAEPATSKPLPCQAMAVNGVDLVFGAAWTPASEEAGRKKILTTAFKEGFTYYTTNEYESTVGLFGALPKDTKNAHAAAVVFAQHFSAGGTELFVFEQGEQCGLVGLMEYAPIPGFDVMGTQAQIQQLMREFSDLNASQLVHTYGNVSWVPDIQSLELNKVAYKADDKSKLKRIPNIMLRLLVGALVVLGLGACVFGYSEYRDAQVAEEAALAAAARNPNLVYEETLAMALRTTGEPGDANLMVWRKFFAQVPLNVGGWNFKTLECKQLVCDIVWARSSGTFKSFEAKLPAALNAVTSFKLDNELVKAEVHTQHTLKLAAALTTASAPVEIRKGLDIKNLPVEHAVQKLWGSQLQDLSLLDSLNVNLSKASLFGGQGAPQELMRPIVKGTWSVDHDIWSLADLPLPSYVVPENLKIARSEAGKLRYKIEGSYYAKAK